MPDEIVHIFTDGACLGNPGPGGWGAILDADGVRKELSGGFKLTTNNRMEILAAVEGLAALTRPCTVDLYTDSMLLRDAVMKRWIVGWVKNGWITSAKKPVKNIDLWKRLIPLLKEHKVTLNWVRGHTGHPENERCDELAGAAAKKPGLPPDLGYKPE